MVAGAYPHRAPFIPLWRQVYFRPFLIFTAVVLTGTVVVMFQLRTAVMRPGFSVLELFLAIQAIGIPKRFGIFFPESDVQTQYGMHAYDTLVELERMFAAAARPVRAGTAAAGELPVHGIRFERVSFAYPESNQRVLAKLDLELVAGESTAVVGLNGAGTTLVKLLSRLYEPDAGRIRSTKCHRRVRSSPVVRISGKGRRCLHVRRWH